MKNFIALQCALKDVTTKIFSFKISKLVHFNLLSYNYQKIKELIFY